MVFYNFGNVDLDATRTHVRMCYRKYENEKKEKKKKKKKKKKKEKNKKASGVSCVWCCVGEGEVKSFGSKHGKEIVQTAIFERGYFIV